MPRTSEEIPIVLFTVKGQDDKKIDFKGRRKKVLDALIWLKKNNFLYHNIIINSDRIQSLPLDGYLEVHRITTQPSSDEVPYDEGPSEGTDNHLQSSSYIPSNISQPKKHSRLLQQTNTENFLDIGADPCNEFAMPCLAGLAFPTLFPDGKGDPTSNSNQCQIANSDTEKFASKLKHLIKFGEKKDGKWHFRFASHPRYGY